MKTLVFWGDGAGAASPDRVPESAVRVAMTEEAALRLRAAGREARGIDHYLGPDRRDALDEAAMAWTKAWGKRPLQDGRSFREIVRWKDVSLWWFAELYLYHSTEVPAYVRRIETFRRVIESERPDEVEAVGLDRVDTLLLERTCTACGVLFLARGGPGRTRGRGRLRVAQASARSRWNGAKAAATALKAVLAGRPPRPEEKGRLRVLFLSHAAFWRERASAEGGQDGAYEHYFDRLIPETGRDPGLEPVVVAVGPRAAFRKRRLRQRLAEWVRLPVRSEQYVHIHRYSDPAVLREVGRGTRQIRRAWKALRRSPAVAESFSHAGVGFSDLAGPALAETMLLQLPWAVRCYEEMARALRALRPAAVCLYAESSGWGRAALAACRAQGVPTVAIQHGILYPKYYSYRHEADEGDCPRPDRTAVFGEAARRLLVGRGHYPPESLVLTGSPKFDELLEGAARVDRAAVRRRWDVPENDRLLVVASRFKAIRDTHQAIGSAFPAFVAAVEALTGVQALVKPHPAEPPDAYLRCLRAAGSSRVRVVPASADLLELLQAADALVTVESLSAAEALVLGRPVVVLNMPSHLRELVEAGVALGVEAGQDPRPALSALLFDPFTRQRLDQARLRYLSELALGVDGRATLRILNLLRETAGGARRQAAAAPW